MALIEQLEDPVASVSADGAYDAAGVYEAAQMKGDGHSVRVLIPPGRNARLSPRPSATQTERNRVTALLLLSDVVRRWKRRAGRILKVLIEPSEVADVLFTDDPASCRYRVILEGEFSDWRTAEPIPEPGGAFLYLVVPQRGALMQVEVSHGETTWRSPAVAESVRVHLSRN